jgi:uncharacterized membrane protein YccC
MYAVNIIAMLDPTNHMVYDLSDFLNNTLAIVAGALAGVAGYRLIPPLSPTLRARRQVAAGLRDLRRLAAGQWRPTAEMWQGRLYDRVIALPKAATPLQRGQLGTALGVGLAILQLRELAGAGGERDGVHRVLSALAAGYSEQARAGATVLVDRLASRPSAGDPVSVQRLCAYLDEIEEAMASHPAFFDGRG